MNDNDNRPLPPIQLLITSCAITDCDSMRLAWLHGYCLLTYRPVGAGLHLDGEILIGERYGENLAMTQHLADALDPDAVLAGYDLTDMISRLGRLPIESNDPQPALDLLAKLRAMLDRQSPIDLAINDESQTAVTLQALRDQLGSDDELSDAAEGELFEFGMLAANQNGGSPHPLALDLAETAGACLLAIGKLYLADELQSELLAAWQQWRDNFQPPLLPPEIGGEPSLLA